MKFRLTAAWAALICVALSAMSAPAAAEVVPWLFDVETPVLDRSAPERRRAEREAMRVVLQRLTGDSAMVSNEAFREALATPNAYYSQFGYISGVGADGFPDLRLRVSFDARPVRDLVRRSGMSVWGTNRPVVVVWLALESETGVRRILSASDAHPLVEALRERAVLRGLPLVLPVLDLTDQAQVSAADVWGLFPDALGGASARYAAQIMIGGRLEASPFGGVAFRGQMLGPEQPLPLSLDALTDRDLGAQLVDRVTAEIASRYAVTADDRNERPFRVRVAAIRQFGDYADLVDFIGSLDGVRSVSVRAVDAAGFEFDVAARGSRELVERLLLLNPRLESMPTDLRLTGSRLPELDPGAADLSFRLLAPADERP